MTQRQNRATFQLIKGPLTYRLLLLWVKNSDFFRQNKKKKKVVPKFGSHFPCFCAMPEVQVFSKVLLKRFCLTQKAGRNSRKLQPYFDHKDSSWKWSMESANLHHFAKKKHSLSEIILPNYVHFFIICGQIMFTSSLFVAKSSFLTNPVPKNFEDFPPNKWITPKYFSHFHGHLEGVPQLKQSDF